jgi:hypothetical protein
VLGHRIERREGILGREWGIPLEPLKEQTTRLWAQALGGLPSPQNRVPVTVSKASTETWLCSVPRWWEEGLPAQLTSKLNQ